MLGFLPNAKSSISWTSWEFKSLEGCYSHPDLRDWQSFADFLLPEIELVTSWTCWKRLRRHVAICLQRQRQRRAFGSHPQPRACAEMMSRRGSLASKPQLSRLLNVYYTFRNNWPSHEDLLAHWRMGGWRYLDQGPREGPEQWKICWHASWDFDSGRHRALNLILLTYHPQWRKRRDISSEVVVLLTWFYVL